MTGLDYVAIGMLLFLASLAIGVFVFLGGWPGRVAAKRRHPYQSAVSIGGWLTLIAGGVLFPLVVMWAYAGSTDADVAAADAAEGGAT
ncbi:DUF3302 domain-containing protein [Tropicibacter sp. R16_0]|uniref:DUF3302 domain-containing protein n=1 Tax=Tropicibacter sp. R16_0 TaxID=2821102 RepID=UPI001ADB77F4|nr:DUF3302 domain-containing protein [Tropicibacter sp. R16_0]MBO9448797.1 DUF3302 domain-containing protein [Tropicibacter sp. R16_0]